MGRVDPNFLLNPTAPEESRSSLLQLRETQRDKQRYSAYHFLITGEAEGTGVRPSYGVVWDRDYNPLPYEEAAPDPDTFEGTAIAFLYGYPYSDHHAWQMAGWNLTRKGSETRGRRKK